MCLYKGADLDSLREWLSNFQFFLFITVQLRVFIAGDFKFSSIIFVQLQFALKMNIGCSECLCIAIESHRPALLKSLLQRSDVTYKDMFWARSPNDWQYDSSTDNMLRWQRYPIPQLHHFGSDSDLSFVGREGCGHMRVDVELQTPFDTMCKGEMAYILVSLPMVARWHSSDSFNAENILRQSGIFDYSQPQFYHTPHCDWFEGPGPLRCPKTNCFRCEYESACEGLACFRGQESPPLVLYPMSSLPCNQIFVVCSFGPDERYPRILR